MGKAERAHHKVEMGTGIRPLPILLNYILFNSCSYNYREKNNYDRNLRSKVVK